MKGVIELGWNFDAGLPVSIQLAERLKREILRGKYPLGSQFPTVRQLAFEVSVNPNTVQKALMSLEGEGLLESRGTVGRFVTSNTAVIDSVQTDMRRQFMRDVMKSAAELGINREAFIEFMKEGEDK